jgi:hypothetical protein
MTSPSSIIFVARRGSPDFKEAENPVKNALAWERASPTLVGHFERTESGYGAIDIIWGMRTATQTKCGTLDTINGASSSIRQFLGDLTSVQICEG